MPTRRELIRTIAGGAAASTISLPRISQAKTLDMCRREASNLAITMRQLTGGQWRVTVDKDLEFVLISKVL